MSEFWERKGISLPIRTVVILILLLLALAFVSWFAFRTKGFSSNEIGQVMDKLSNLFGG